MNNVSPAFSSVLDSEQESDHSDRSMHSEPGTPQTGPGGHYSDLEDSGSENQSDDERLGEGARKSEDEERHCNTSTDEEKSDEENSDDESSRNRNLESPESSDIDIGEKKSRKAAVDYLFGDVSSDSDAEKPSAPGQPLDDAGDGMEGEQPDGERPDKEQLVPKTCTIEVEMPKVSADLGSDLYFATLPNSLFVEPKPFDPQYYEDEFEEEDFLDEEVRTRLKPKVENTIRWRAKTDEQGNETRESNTRIVKWSDGSMSLHLGNEVFDVCKASPQGTHNHLFIRHGADLQGLAVLKTKLTFKPHSTDIADRCSKKQKIRMLPMARRDPESQRHEMIKKDQERLRASVRRESQQSRMKMKQHQSGLSSSYLEDGEEAVSLAAIKSKYKGGGFREEQSSTRRIYSSDSDEGSDDDKAQRLMKAKTFDEEEGEGKRKAEGDDEAATKRAKKSVISDEEEEDEVDDE